ncbi:MAG: hypothetical protein V4527_12405 [Pseudomonadota bacterium]|jgi:hypothetical protein
MTSSARDMDFRYSRIYAQGWNAARSLVKTGNDAADAAALNPYRLESERARWNEGFAKALE